MAATANMNEQLQSILTLLGSMNTKLDKLEESRQDVIELKKEMKEIQSKVKDFGKSIVDLEKRVAALELEKSAANATAAEPVTVTVVDDTNNGINLTNIENLSSEPAELSNGNGPAVQYNNDEDIWANAEAENERMASTIIRAMELIIDKRKTVKYNDDSNDCGESATGVWDICNYDSDTGICEY